MTLIAQDLVNREVLACCSSLVSTLASAYGVWNATQVHDMLDLTEQAFELASPVLDYEEAARQAGWVLQANECDYQHPESESIYNNVETLCECEEIDPYEWEIFEHWIVTDWLADRLIEQGEKVDKDFANLCVWARTTTGQAIYADAVIERIAAALNAAA